MAGSKPTARCGREEAKARWRAARSYLDAAGLILAESERDDFLVVAAGLAALAGVVASESLCCATLTRRHRGADRRQAVELLENVVPDGRSLATTLDRLLDVKDEALEGSHGVSARRARDAVRWAESLVARAGREVS